MKSLTVASRIAPRVRVGAATLLFLMAQAALTAVPVKFRPGAADACEPNVNRIPGASPADLDQYEDVTAFEWVVLHPTSGTAAGLPDDKHVLFDVTTPATNQLPAGAGFNLAFTMRLVGVAGGKQYGLDTPGVPIYIDNTRSTLGSAPVPYPTHVFMRATVQGTLRSTRGFSSYPANSLVQSNPEFTQAQFRMFFDADGDPATTADQVAIAKFGTTSAPDPLSSMASTTFIDQGVANLLVNWDSALPGVFTNQGGFELATGAPDAAPDNALRRVSTATAPTGQADINFRFACVATGPCFVSTGTVLQMKLETRGGGTVATVVPASTQPPAALCPPDLTPDTNATCFPFAYCPFPYFWFVVVLLVIVLVTVVVVRARQSQKQYK